MKLFLKILFLTQTLHELTPTSADEQVGRVPYLTPRNCTDLCPDSNSTINIYEDTCNHTLIGSCFCSYRQDAYCQLQCGNSSDWMLMCQRGVSPGGGNDSNNDNQGETLIPTASPTTSVGQGAKQPLFETPASCTDKCPAEIPDWENEAQCNVTEFDSCICTYDDPYCYLECGDDYPGTGTGTWMMACAGGGGGLPDSSGNNNDTIDSDNTTNVGEFGVFTTPPDCTDLCPAVIPDWHNEAPCNVTEIGDCSCTYDDSSCFLQCSDYTGTWMMACAGGGGGLLDSSENKNVTIDSDNTTDVGEFGVFTTPLHCTDLCPAVIPDWQNEAPCNVTEIDNCSCTYTNHPNCFVECADNANGSGTWMMACAGGGGGLPDSSGNNNDTIDSDNTTNVGEFGVFTTPPDCTDLCPAETPDWLNEAPCNVTEIGDCSCTYDDPSCFLECVDDYTGTGTWMMACAGGDGGLPDSSENNDATIEKTTDVSVFGDSTTTGTGDSPSPFLDVHTTFVNMAIILIGLAL